MHIPELVVLLVYHVNLGALGIVKSPAHPLALAVAVSLAPVMVPGKSGTGHADDGKNECCNDDDLFFHDGLLGGAFGRSLVWFVAVFSVAMTYSKCHAKLRLMVLTY